MPSYGETTAPALRLRDYLAGCALTGILADGKPPAPDRTARLAVEYADALASRLGETMAPPTEAAS